MHGPCATCAKARSRWPAGGRRWREGPPWAVLPGSSAARPSPAAGCGGARCPIGRGASPPGAAQRRAGMTASRNPTTPTTSATATPIPITPITFHPLPPPPQTPSATPTNPIIPRACAHTRSGGAARPPARGAAALRGGCRGAGQVRDHQAADQAARGVPRRQEPAARAGGAAQARVGWVARQLGRARCAELAGREVPG
jgi:hypothetical protein